MMKALRKLLLLVAVIFVSDIALAEPITYINTELPGITQKESPTGEMCWYDGMGNNLGTVENSLPMVEIDKFYFFMGDKDNPWVKKEWDKKRNCYVWKSIDGDFLGTDPESISEKDLEWLANVDPTWFEENNLPPEINDKLWEMKFEQLAKQAEKEMAEAEKLAEEEEAKKAKEKKKLDEADKYMSMTDEQIRQAEAEIAKARAELQAAGATEYMGYLDQAQAAINEAKAARAKYKKERGEH